jgi:hypothetical protein
MYFFSYKGRWKNRLGKHTCLTSLATCCCCCCCAGWRLQDLLLAFVDCVERNGAKLAIPRTVLELDPSMDAEAILGPRMTAVGLLPASVGGYGSRGPNIPITVQVGVLCGNNGRMC